MKRVNKYISKDKILDELNKEFKINTLGSYSKNDANIFEKVTKDGKINTAIKNCKYMEQINKTRPLSKRNPMTKVYKIVEELKEYIE